MISGPGPPGHVWRCPRIADIWSLWHRCHCHNHLPGYRQHPVPEQSSVHTEGGHSVIAIDPRPTILNGALCRGVLKIGHQEIGQSIAVLVILIRPTSIHSTPWVTEVIDAGGRERRCVFVDCTNFSVGCLHHTSQNSLRSSPPLTCSRWAEYPSMLLPLSDMTLIQ